MYRKIPEKTTDIRRDKGSKIHFSVNIAAQSRKKLSETGKKYKTKKITDQILFTLKGVIIYNKKYIYPNANRKNFMRENLKKG